MEQLHLVARRSLNTFNAAVSKLRLKLLTDTDKPISKERVLVLTADGKVVMRITDDDGVADFSAIPTAPLSLAFIVLPDVLEGWNNYADEQLNFDILGDLELQLPSVQSADDPQMTSPLLDTEAQIQLINGCQALSKDGVLELLVGESQSLRSKDFSKHLFWTQKVASDKTVELKIDKLTMAQKFGYLRDFVEDPAHDVVYYPGTLNYDPKNHLFTATNGVDCNRFGNFFLAFWFNHNHAFTPDAHVADFTTIMDELGSAKGVYVSKDSKDVDENGSRRKYHIRGFNDVSVLITPPKGVSYRRDGGGRDYMNTIMKDKKVWDSGAHKYVSADLMSALSEYNVFGVADGSDPENLNFGHHGGIMIKESSPDADGNVIESLHKMAGDGDKRVLFNYDNVWYEYPHPPADRANVDRKLLELSGQKKAPTKVRYTQKRVGYHFMDEKSYADRHNLHLRLWALTPLRAGGYAPGDEAGNFKSASYSPIDATAVPGNDIDSASVNFRLWLPRFIQWDESKKDESVDDATKGSKIDTFLKLATKTFKVDYTVTTKDVANPKNSKVVPNTVTVVAKNEEIAKLRVQNDHTPKNGDLAFTKVTEVAPPQPAAKN